MMFLLLNFIYICTHFIELNHWSKDPPRKEFLGLLFVGLIFKIDSAINGCGMGRMGGLRLADCCNSGIFF